MRTPIDTLTVIEKNLTNNTELLDRALNKVSDLEAKNVFQEAYIVLVMGFIVAIDKNDDFIEYLKIVSTSEYHPETVRTAASKVLQQRQMWPDELMGGSKH